MLHYNHTIIIMHNTIYITMVYFPFQVVLCLLRTHKSTIPPPQVGGMLYPAVSVGSL